MPRNASGNFTLPLPAVVTGTVIESVWANTTMNDLAASITDSLDRYGRGGMVAPFRMVDGTVSVPAIAFASETNTGFYRSSAGVASISVLGVEQQTWTTAGTTVATALNVIGELNATGPLEIGGGTQITGGVSRFLGGSQVLITNSSNASLAPFVTRWFVSNVTPILQVLGTTAATAGELLGRFSADNAPPLLILNKSRNNTVGSHTIVQIGDCMGGIHFGGSDGVQILDAARIAAFVDAAPGVDVMPTRLSFWTTSANQPVERMRLSSDGLGVGISAFSNAAANRGLIEVNGSSEAMLAMKITGSNRASLLAGTNFDLTAYGAAAAMTFTANNAERMRIDASGNVGMATTAAAGVRLHVKGNGEILRLETTTARNSGSDYLAFYDPSGRKGYFGYGGATDDLYINNELVGGMFLMVNGATRMHIASSGFIGVPNPSTTAQFEVVSSGAGILSKTASENATVAALGVWNQNPNSIQWYVTLNGAATQQHTPRGIHEFYISGVNKFTIGPTTVVAQGAFQLVNGASSVQMLISPNPLLQFFYSGIADWRIAVDSAASLFYDFGGGTIRARLTNTGAWIVGTNAPSQGYQNIMSQSLEGASGYGVFNHITGTAGGTLYIAFGYAGGGVGAITQNGTTGVNYATTSDARFKENVVDMPDVGAIVDALKPRLFNFISEPDRTLAGLIAQEAVEVLPEIVSYIEEVDQWGIDYGKLTPLLLREIQSLRARVAALGG